MNLSKEYESIYAERRYVKKKLTVGISSFRELITGNFLYVDKTRSIYDLFKDGGRFFFIARPRRFGKTLLISTLKELFEGNRDLFKDLWIDSSDYTWEHYPVLMFDFSELGSDSPQEFKNDLKYILNQKGEELGIDLSKAPSFKTKLKKLGMELAKKNKENKIVILVDEYDFPVINTIDNSSVMQANLKILKGFFTAIKGLGSYLRAVFITGVSQIPKASIFTGLSDLNNISLKPIASTLLGYTKEELQIYFSDYITLLAHKEGVSYEVMQDKIQLWYNGYRFSEKDVTVYNPFSLHYLFVDQKFDNYWFQSATPSFLFELLKKNDSLVKEGEMRELSSDELTMISLENPQLHSALFQTGYLTISLYDKRTDGYLLNFPNYEVRKSYSLLFLSVITGKGQQEIKTIAGGFCDAIYDNDMPKLCSLLNSAFASISYFIDKRDEASYHQLLCFCIKMLGFECYSEVTTNKGRIDLLVTTKKYIYIFELKIDAPAESALKQIEDKSYYEQFLNDEHKRAIVLVGLAFNKQKGETTVSCVYKTINAVKP